MSLQTKIIGLMLFVFTAYGALDYGVQRLFILPSYQSLEKEEALKNMDRVIQAVEREVQHLDSTATDWSVWDDTYQFIKDRNKAYYKANLNTEALDSLKINLLYILDEKRQPIWGMLYDYYKNKKLPTPYALEKFIASPLVDLKQPESKSEGILITSLGPMMIVAKPVLKSNGGGPVGGVILQGRFLETGSIAEQTRNNLRAIVIGDRSLKTEEKAITTELDNSGKSFLRENRELNSVYHVISDIYGTPALLLKIDVPKSISARGRTAVEFAMFSLFGAGLAILGVLIIGLRLMMIQPLRQLTNHAVALGKSDNLSARLSMNRRDEFGKLAREFDRMVERVAETRKELVEQSYFSGLAEMAVGVLHNIGNAITPLTVKLNGLKGMLQKAPTKEVEMAVAELSDPATSAERLTALNKFLELAGMKFTDLIRFALQDLETVGNHVNHIQLILADQQRFARAPQAIETFDVRAFVARTVDLLPENIRNSIAVEQDPSLKWVGQVRSSMIALQQVFTNLMINAAESIYEKGLTDKGGIIRIYAFNETIEESAMIHIYVEDNGMGIPGDNLGKIFERGFSTKARGSGLGLHWCANTITSLQGKLSAKSKGDGIGAIFHILLPLASSEKQEGDICLSI
jgi:two-component system, NtrC family, sensor kinase